MKHLRKIEVVAALLAVFFVLGLYSHMGTPTGAVISDVYNVDYAVSNMDELKVEYNNNLDRVPNVAKTLFGSEKIKLVIAKEDGSELILSIDTNDGVLKEITLSEFDEYTLTVWIDEKTVNEIVDSDDQVTRFVEAIDNEEITYKAEKITTRAKLYASSFFLKVAGWFR